MKIAGLLAFAALAPLLAQTAAEDPIVTTHHQVSVGGRSLAYTARAGQLPIRENDTGEVRARMFFVAYTLDRADPAPRPLTFLWNGGPGSNSGLVHLLGFGPKRVTRATGSLPLLSPAGTALADNQDTWLAFTDLVFVDPVGTGYSRPVKPEYGADFYQNRGDAESVAEFIRVYRTHFDAFDAPLFILGESYGVTRSALVADALERRHTRLSGVILLSGGFPLVQLEESRRNALYLPTLTAAAHVNRKLPADLQTGGVLQAVHAAEVYARGDYAAALAKPEALSDTERDAMVNQLARFTGLPAGRIDRTKLIIPMEQFSNDLLADRNLMVGHYDSRLTGPRNPSPQYDPTADPSLKDILDSASVLRYLRNELGYRSDLFYQGPFGGGYPPPASPRGDWMSVRWNFTSQPSALDALQNAVRADPNLRVMVVHGYYDLVFSYFAIEQAAAQLPPDLARRVTVKSYAGGHAIYTDDAVRRQFRQDAEKFYRSGNAR